MDPKSITKGTMLTYTRKPLNNDLYLVVDKITNRAGTIRIYAESVHSYHGKEYAGAVRFKEPYIFTEDEFNERISVTDEKIADKVRKDFEATGKTVWGTAK